MHALRIARRFTTLLLLASAAISLAALGGEYPGETAAGRRVVTREVLPLALLAWMHLGALDAREHRRRRWWVAVAIVGDGALLATGLARASVGAAPLTLALPAIAALLLVATIGVAWRDAEADDRKRITPAPDDR